MFLHKILIKEDPARCDCRTFVRPDLGRWELQLMPDCPAHWKQLDITLKVAILNREGWSPVWEESVGDDKKPPKKVKISKKTGSKIRKSAQLQPGADKASLLAKIAEALRKKQ